MTQHKTTVYCDESALKFSDSTDMIDTNISENSITKRYREALKHTNTLVVLHEGEDVLVQSEASSTCQSSPSLKLTPAILSTEDATVLYGYFVESDDGGSAFNRSSKSEFGLEPVLPNVDGYEFINVAESGKTIVMTLGPGGKETKKKRIKHRQNSNIIEESLETPDLIEINASVGGTIEKHNLKTVIPARKIQDSVFVGALGVRTYNANSTLKFYFDKRLHKVTKNILKDDRVRNVSIELCS